MGWRGGCNLPYRRRYFWKKMLVRKTAKTRLLQRERKKEQKGKEGRRDGGTEGRREIHDFTVSSFSVCNHFWQNKPYLCSIFQTQWIFEFFKIWVNSIPAANIVTIASFLDWGWLFTPCYITGQNKAFQTSHLNPYFFCFCSLFTLITNLNSISSCNH